jgi:hypothetical protein
MTKRYFAFLFLVGVIHCCANSQPNLSVINNNPDFEKTFFRAGDNLYLRNTYDLSRIEIISDTKNNFDKKNIVYYSSKGSVDTIDVGTFLTPGLYVVTNGIAKKNNYNDYVLKDSIWRWQIPGYIHYQLSGGAYLGVYWKLGTEDSLLDSNRIYIYSYAPGTQFDDSNVSSILAPKLKEDDQKLSQLYDSLQFAFSNVHSQYFTDRLNKLGENFSAHIDSANHYQFSFYLTKENFVRLLVTDSSSHADTSKILCETILDSLVDIFLSDSLTVKNTDSTFKKVPLISSDLSVVLKHIIDSALFENLSENCFFLNDSNNVENSLRAFDSSYVPMTSTVWANVINNNASQQIILMANIIGTDTSKSGASNNNGNLQNARATVATVSVTSRQQLLMPTIEDSIKKQDTFDFDSGNSAYEFSGMAIKGDTIFLIGEDDHHLVGLNKTAFDQDGSKIKVFENELPIPKSSQLEGICVSDDDAFVVDEANDAVYTYNFKTQAVKSVVITASLKNPKNSTDYGLEGIAIKRMARNVSLCYILREKTPQDSSEIYIFKIKKNNIRDTFNLIKTIKIKQDISDERYSDIFYYNSHLYMLRTKVNEYEIDALGLDVKTGLPENDEYNTSKIMKLNISDWIKQKDPQVSTNLEGMCIEKASLYLVSDNHDKGNLNEAKLKTLLKKFPIR